MKILIGTSIHQCKDYCMERWLKNVAELQQQTPSDLFLVDNSADSEYAEKVKNYCVKYGIADYKIKHLELDHFSSFDMRRSVAKEVLRREILSYDYDAWFSWGNDQIIPTEALDRLIKLMKAGDFMMVMHNSWDRSVSILADFDIACTLITRKCLELIPPPPPEGDINFDHATHWLTDWLETYILRSGGSFAEVYGVISPIYHLSNQGVIIS